MSTNYEDWADWAGDNTQQAEADRRKEREKADAKAEARYRDQLNLVRNSTIEDRDGADSAALYAKERREREAAQCEHTEVYSDGNCADCEEPVEGFEPSDAQIFAHYGQTKSYGDAA